MEKNLVNHIRAGFGVLSISSSEETRTLDCLRRVGDQMERKVFIWSLTRGMVDLQNGHSQSDMRDPMAFLEFLANSENSIGALLDPEPFIKNPEFKRLLKDKISSFRCSRTLVLIGVSLEIPSDLAHLVAMIESPLPNREDLAKVIDDVASGADITVTDDEKDKAITALSGLTTDAAADAVALSLVESKKVTPEIISREKCSNLSKREHLKVIENLPSIDDVGGLENLKSWLTARVKMFTREARDFGLPTPKGFLMVGVPGCGKSLVAKATASILKIPLVRLDIGAVMGSLVGQSEANIREAIFIAEAMAPCVLWLDEMDKQLGTSEGQDGHEVTKRVLSSILTWLQEKTSPVFVVATANNIQSLAKSKPELLRKGRWDETFFVDLPNKTERAAIFEIHIRKYRPDLDFDSLSLVNATEGFSGAEIEATVSDAMFAAFSKGQDLDNRNLLDVISRTVPMSRFASDNISSLREWCRDRTRPASIMDVAESKRKVKV